MRLLALALGLLLFAAVVSSQDADDLDERLVDDGRTSYLEDVSNNDCLRCHQLVGEEWRKTTHATAWVDERYQAALKSKRRPKSCWGCHVPVNLSTGSRDQRPEPRDEDRHLGVSCASCHVAPDGETILGPHGIETDAHPSQKSELFDRDGDSTMCVQCHDTTIGPVIGIARSFVDTEQYELGLSCVECHMPALTRVSANDPEKGIEDVTSYPERKVRSHRLASPRDPVFLRKAFLLRATLDGERTLLEIENQSGHRIPGLIERAFTFELTLLDADGEPISTAEHTIDNRSYLPVEETISIALEGQGAQLEVRALHSAPGIKPPVEFWSRTLDVD